MDEAGKTGGIGVAAIGLRRDDRLNGVAEAFERRDELARHAAVAGDAAVSDRIERGVERDAQDGLRGR